MTHTIHRRSFSIPMTVLAGAITFASALPAQTPAWFPLEVGNTWLYRPVPNSNRVGNADPRTISVESKETISGRDYFNVSYFGRVVTLRTEPSDGSVISYDRASGTESPFLSLGLPVGGTFPTKLDPCSTTGTIAARDASVNTAAGQFNNVVQVRFQGSCADAGTVQQSYAPYIGLVQDEETSFAGPLVYELAYYHVGTSTGGVQETSFTVSTDSPQYPVAGTLQARLTLRSTSLVPIPMHFPSGQSFEFKILNDKGEVVYLWSKGRAFTMIIRDLKFGPGEQTYGVAVPLTDLPAGHYTAVGYLTTDPLLYQGQVGFDVVTVFPTEP